MKKTLSIENVVKNLAEVYNKEILNTQSSNFTEQQKYEILKYYIKIFKFSLAAVEYCFSDKIIKEFFKNPIDPQGQLKINTLKNNIFNIISLSKKLDTSTNGVLNKIKAYFNKNQQLILAKDITQYKKYQDFQSDFKHAQELEQKENLLNRERNTSAEYSKKLRNSSIDLHEETANYNINDPKQNRTKKIKNLNQVILIK